MDRLINKGLIEFLSAKEHKRWTKWQRYLHSNCIKCEDGSLIIPKEKVERWERQINTDFEDLSEEEKQADRNQVYEILNNIKNFEKNNTPKGIVIAGFGAIGKTYLSKKYANVIDMESGFFKHINIGFEHIDVEKRKGTSIRPENPDWPSNYYNAILNARKHYDIILTSMHWDLLKFYEEIQIPYYIAFPEQNLEDEYAKRCYSRGNNEIFTEHMIKNIKLWNERLKNYKPLKILYLKSNEFLEDKLKKEKIL